MKKKMKVRIYKKIKCKKKKRINLKMNEEKKGKLTNIKYGQIFTFITHYFSKFLFTRCVFLTRSSNNLKSFYLLEKCNQGSETYARKYKFERMTSQHAPTHSQVHRLSRCSVRTFYIAYILVSLYKYLVNIAILFQVGEMLNKKRSFMRHSKTWNPIKVMLIKLVNCSYILIRNSLDMMLLISYTGNYLIRVISNYTGQKRIFNC